MTIHEAKAAMIQLVNLFDGQLPPDQLDGMRQDSNAGEVALALENLCTQIDEYELTITSEALTVIHNIGAAMNVSSRYWKKLNIG